MLQWGTDKSPVVAPFKSNAHFQAGMAVMVIDQMYSHNLPAKRPGKHMDQDYRDLVHLRNEPQSQ